MTYYHVIHQILNRLYQIKKIPNLSSHNIILKYFKIYYSTHMYINLKNIFTGENKLFVTIHKMDLNNQPGIVK